MRNGREDRQTRIFVDEREKTWEEDCKETTVHGHERKQKNCVDSVACER